MAVPSVVRFARFVLLFLVLLSLIQLTGAQQPTKDENATAFVAGRVTVGGKPAVGVRVVLVSSPSTSIGPPLPLFGRMPPVANAVTDEDGRYRVGPAPPGTYRVMPVAPTSTTADGGLGGDRSIILSDGETVEGVDIRLIRGGVISGRITSVTGLPLIEESVTLMRIESRGPATPFYSPSFNPQLYRTDDRGAFRLYGLPPGRYLVSSRSEGGSLRRYRYLNTFHPDTTEESKAAVVELTEGGEVNDANIVVTPLRSYSASGRIVDAGSGKPVANIGCSLAMTRDREFSSVFGNDRSNARGEFRFEALLPGAYTVFISNFGEGDYARESLRFEITDSDVSGLEIKAQRGATISGTVVIEGPAEPGIQNKISRLGLSAISMTQPPSASILPPDFIRAQVGPDGSFVLKGLQQGRVRLSLSMPVDLKGLSLQRVEQAGVDKSAGWDITPGAQITGVRVVLGHGSGVIRGEVKVAGGEIGESGRILVTYRATGTTVPGGRSVGADARGRFVIEGLVAGEYEVTARIIQFVRVPTPVAQPQQVKQVVNVVNGAETPVTLVIDLAAKGEGRER